MNVLSEYLTTKDMGLNIGLYLQRSEGPIQKPKVLVQKSKVLVRKSKVLV